MEARPGQAINRRSPPLVYNDWNSCSKKESRSDVINEAVKRRKAKEREHLCYILCCVEKLLQWKRNNKPPTTSRLFTHSKEEENTSFLTICALHFRFMLFLQTREEHKALASSNQTELTPCSFNNRPALASTSTSTSPSSHPLYFINFSHYHLFSLIASALSFSTLQNIHHSGRRRRCCWPSHRKRKLNVSEVKERWCGGSLFSGRKSCCCSIEPLQRRRQWLPISLSLCFAEPPIRLGAQQTN